MDLSYLFLICIYIEKCMFICHIVYLELLGRMSQADPGSQQFPDGHCSTLSHVEGHVLISLSVWTSKGTEQQHDTTNLLSVLLWCLVYKGPKWFTACNEKRVMTNMMQGTVPGCWSPALARDLYSSSLAKSRTESRFLGHSSTLQKQSSVMVLHAHRTR